MSEPHKPKLKKDEDKYAFITDDMFDKKLLQCMKRYSMESILQIEGVYEHVAEYFNNEVLDELLQEHMEEV